MVDLKVSVITDEFSQEFDDVCEHLQKYDVEFVELRQVWLGNILQISDQTVGDALDVLNGCGLKVSSIAGPFLKCAPPSVNPEPKDPASYSENWKYNYSLFDRALAVADTFKARYIRCFGYNGDFKCPPVSEWGNFPIYQEWKDAVSGFAARAAEKGKMLVCENEGGLVKVLRQMEFVGKAHCGPGFGMLYDTANVANKDGKSGILSEEWLPRFVPYIQYVHAKGCKEGPLGTRSTCLVNDKGDICRWPRLVEYFRQAKPSDFVAPAPDPLFLSIETHMGKKNTWENSDASLKNLQELVNA